MKITYLSKDSISKPLELQADVKTARPRSLFRVDDLNIEKCF